MVVTIVVDHPLDLPLSPAHLLFFPAFPFPFEPALHHSGRKFSLEMFWYENSTMKSKSDRHGFSVPHA